jgi:hypothetical protein
MPERRLVGAAVLAALAAAACVSPRTPGVRVDAAQADIVFGIEEPETKEAPVAPPPESGASDGSGGIMVPWENDLPDRFDDVDFTVDPGELARQCPDAPLGEAPDTIAPDTPTAPPAAGFYKIKKEGTRTFTQAGFPPVKTQILGLDPRIVRAVERTGDQSWTWETVEAPPEGSFTRVYRWSTRVAPTNQSASTPYVGENPVRVSEPSNGVTLTRITDYDGNGNVVAEFAPSTPLTYLPLPVLPGETFRSVGVSPRSGQAVQVDGEVMERRAVDACGTRIDGWLVHLTFTDSAGDTHKEEVVISTEMGGLMLSRHIVQTTVAGGTTTSLDATYTLGQVKPSPAPSEDDA